MKTTSKQFKTYLIFAFGLAWILQVLASKFAKDGNILIYQFLLLATMFMPLLATLISKIPLKGMGWKISKKDIKYILFSLWSPALLSLLGAGLFFLLFPYSFDSGFETLTAIIGEVGIKQM
ncbi:MAG: hypothetical protein GX219_05995 [Tissierellia bacterium]|nr:hypothetical protein [Tissierellia bacterium]